MKIETEEAVQIFMSAVESVHPARLMQQHIRMTNEALYLGGKTISRNSFNAIYVIGAGKASAAMAVETERILGSLITSGQVTTKYNHALPAQKIKILEAGHPTPDENGVRAVSSTLQLLSNVGK